MNVNANVTYDFKFPLGDTPTAADQTRGPRRRIAADTTSVAGGWQ